MFEMYAQFFQAAEKQVAAFGIALQVDKQHALHWPRAPRWCPKGNGPKSSVSCRGPTTISWTACRRAPSSWPAGLAVSDELWDGRFESFPQHDEGGPRPLWA